jgi:carboxymethylenebutenolidase
VATNEVLASGMNVWWSRPAGSGPKPLVVILHERYGPVQHNFDLLNRIAESGFVGAMPDLFHRYEGDRRPIEEGQARAELPDNTCLADINELIDHMLKQDFVDGERIGVVGFCQSGRAPLMMASRRSDLRGIGVFYGGIYPRDYDATEQGQETTLNFIPKLSCPVLGIFGENDELVPIENVWRFRSLLEQHNKSYHIRLFAGAPHGWLNDTVPERYRPQQATAAWRTLESFFNGVFGNEPSSERIYFRFESDIPPDKVPVS